MKKPYSLDYDIERDVDRTAAVIDILDKLEKNPSPNELEQMADYILYGKDEDGLNAVQRGEVNNGQRRYSNFKTKAEKNLSLDEILENPLVNQNELQPTNKRDPYLHKKPTIAKPKYDKKTGEMIDPGDSDIPGMVELWQSIDRMEHWIHVLEGKLAATEDDILFDDPYRLYRLKHNLIDMRRHQYYLKDAYKPTLHFASMDRPKAQYVDWTSDSGYWITLEQWRKKVAGALLSSVSTNLDDYETKTLDDGTVMVHWIVRRHHFDWENPAHIRALISNYDALYDQLREKLDTYGRTLIFDFERYRAMCNFSPVREFILQCKIEKMNYNVITYNLQVKFGLTYNENHLCVILNREIPEKFAEVAKKHRLLIETPPDQMKICKCCGRAFPPDPLFFVRSRNRKDGFASNCKECEKKKRIEKGGQTADDRRNKETQVLKMQAGEAGN